MSKALNKKNLLALGPERLADLLIEVTKGRADMQRRLRLELSAHEGTDDVSRDIRKRYSSIRQAKGYLSRKTHRNFAKEIRSLIALIESGVAPADPNAAFELLWELLHLAQGVFDRTNDTSGILSEAFADAVTAVGRIAPALTLPPESLSETVLEGLRHDASGIFAGVVAALAIAMKPEGLENLKRLAATAMIDTTDVRRRRLRAMLRDIADVQGDVNAYIAHLTARELTDEATAAAIATRLMAANRAGEALEITRHHKTLEHISIAGLEALGRKEDLKTFLWQSFNVRPDADRLRRYLRLLPDFDDIEAEDQARTIAQNHSDLHAALRFFIEWPDHTAAGSLVTARYGELDGSDPDLCPFADALEAGFPLPSVLLRRAVILSALRRGTAADDRFAAEHLLACAAADAFIADYGDIPDHADFMARLHRIQGRRKAFWARVI